jgi:DNA-binding NarL/FixJ family response regulator
MSTLRIFVADDHEIVRRVITALLAFHPDWEICGEAPDGNEAVQKVAHLKPDIVLLDIDMPNMSGLEATRQVVRSNPACKVIVLTVTNTEQVVRDVFQAGAMGFINKANATHDLVAAIEAVQRGRTFFTARFAEMIVKNYLQEGRIQGANEPVLTEHERATIRLLTDELNMTLGYQWRKPRVAGKATRYFAVAIIVLTFAGVWWYVLNGEPEHAPAAVDKVIDTLGLKSTPAGAASGNPDTNVWIDVHTALYYCPGSDAYGKTHKGRFARQRDAQLDQFQPAAGKPCD